MADQLPTTLEEIRKIALSMPATSERLSHGTPSFFIAEKKVFIHVWPKGHHKSNVSQLWCAATIDDQAMWLSTRPERCFRPPYVGHRGWIGVRLDGGLDADDLSEFLDDAYRCVATPALIAQLDART